jgi:endonuclease YncB( thermonuclease family)
MSFQIAHLIAVEEDLSLRIKTKEREEVVALLGIDTEVPMDAASREEAREFLQEVLSHSVGMRILWEGERRDPAGRRLVYVDYFVAQDKSGSIWRDAGAELIHRGLCQVDDRYPFKRREDYK